MHHVQWFFQAGWWLSRDLRRCQELASSVAWAVYGTRFRHGGRDVVQNLISEIGWPAMSAAPVSWSLEPGKVVIGNMVATRAVPDDLDLAHKTVARITASGASGDFSDARLKLVADIHAAVRVAIMAHDFVSQYGL